MIKIALYIFIFCFWILFGFAMIWATWVIDEIHTLYASSKNPVSCNIDSSLQEKIEQTYENITSFKCTTNP